MTITDETRYHLHQRLEAVLGPDEASTLMEHLPPVGWADVVTKRDLDQFAVVSKQDLVLATTELRLEIAGLRTELKDEISTRTVATERHLRGWVLGSQALVLTVLGLLIQLH